MTDLLIGSVAIDSHGVAWQLEVPAWATEAEGPHWGRAGRGEWSKEQPPGSFLVFMPDDLAA